MPFKMTKKGFGVVAKRQFQLMISGPNNFAVMMILSVFLETTVASERPLFEKVEIYAPFHRLLLENPEFMRDGGARILHNSSYGWAIIGIGKATPKDKSFEAVLPAKRSGEIAARIAILELGEGIHISTSRGLREAPSLSSFFQVTKTQVEGEIELLPVIGTWWSADRHILYVAVGRMMDGTDRRMSASDGAEMAKPIANGIRGEEPFLSLIRVSPVLRRNGGVVAFAIGDNRKALIAVASTLLKGSGAKAEKIARLKAVRALLGHRTGVHVSSVEYLKEQEQLVLDKNGKKYVLLSDLLSMQEEKLAGIIKSLPVVAAWEEPKGKVLHVAIGRVWP